MPAAKLTSAKKTATKTKTKAKSPRKPSVKISKPKTASGYKRSPAEEKFATYWDALYPDIDLHEEHKFLEDRKFRFDFANLESKIAIEINGGNWVGGRHTNALALEKEYEKFSLAAREGWRIFVLSPKMITAKWLRAIAEAIQT